MKTEKLFFLLSVYFYPNKTFREENHERTLTFARKSVPLQVIIVSVLWLFKTVCLKALRSFLNRYLFIYLSKVTLYYSIRWFASEKSYRKTCRLFVRFSTKFLPFSVSFFFYVAVSKYIDIVAVEMYGLSCLHTYPIQNYHFLVLALVTLALMAFRRSTACRRD